MKSEILNKDFDFKAVHIGLFLDDNLWQYDKWTVVIEGQQFDYKTGIGHRKALTGWQAGYKNYKGYKNQAEYYLKNHNWKQDKENLIGVNKKIKEFSKVKPLNIDDVLYSLLMDSSLSSELFQDFCDNLGYDTDSRKALQMYEDCQKNAVKVKQFINNIDEAAEKFQDY